MRRKTVACRCIFPGFGCRERNYPSQRRFPDPAFADCRWIARSTLQAYWQTGHPEAEQPLRAWHAEVVAANWNSMADINSRYAQASIIGAERFVFNIGGNKFRLVAKVWFAGQAAFIKFA